MRRRLPKSGYGFLALLGMLVLALWPFLAHPGLPRFTDAELHVFRLAELMRMVSNGELYPRWAPYFYFGYGYPIFNYYAPLSYFAGLPVALMPWWDAVAGVRFVFIAGMVSGVLGIYAFTRTHWGRAAGLVAAAATGFAPYVLYVDPHARGDLAEAFGLGLFPLALWAVARLRHGSAASWLVAVAAVSAVIVSHNLLALVSFALLLAWVSWRCVTGDETRPLCLLRLAALAAGIGVAAFFWLPVALEQNAVNLGSLIGPGSHFDYRNHFLTLGQLLAAPELLDWGASEPAFPFQLGTGQWLLALSALLLLLVRKTRHARHVTFFVVAAGVMLIMMLRVSDPVWDAVPLLAYLQFPWRLLGPTAALMGVLAGVTTDTILRLLPGSTARVLVAGFVLLVIASSFPLLQVQRWSGEAWDTSAAGVLAEELRGRWLGTTSTADFVPATVEVIPRPTGQLLEDIFAGEPADRVNRATLPEGSVVIGEPITPLRTRYHVSSPTPFPLRLYQFAFPGWTARLNGAPVATEVGLPEGFFVVPLPAGDYIVEVALEATPVQRVAWILSGATLIVIAGIAIALRRRSLGSSPEASAEPESLAVRAVFVAVLIAALLYGLLARAERLHVESTGYRAIPATHDIYASFDGAIAVIGYDAPEQARRGTIIPVTVYWKAQKTLVENYQVFVHLTGEDGTLVAQSDKLNPGDFPTKRWTLDRYVRDQHRLALPKDLAPGEYRLTAGLWLHSADRRLPVFDASGQPIGDAASLGRLMLRE
jgi:hypothetical protein